MRALRTRVAVGALVAVVILAAGSLVPQHGSGTATHEPGTTPATTAANATRELGSLGDQLRRLPPLAPGDLQGVLYIASSNCTRQAIDLRTLAIRPVAGRPCPAGCVTAPRGCVVLRPQGGLGPQILLPDDPRKVDELLRHQWLDWGVTPDGRVQCATDFPKHARLRRPDGRVMPLPSCPLLETAAGRLVFAEAGRRRIVDEAGRLIAPLPAPTASRPILVFGDGMAAVGTRLYRHGRQIVSFPEALGSIVSGDRTGRVAIVADATQTHLTVHVHGVSHRIDIALATTGGAVAPDGRTILLQHGPSLLIVLDAATLRPIARLDLSAGAQLVDWLSGNA